MSFSHDEKASRTGLLSSKRFLYLSSIYLQKLNLQDYAPSKQFITITGYRSKITIYECEDCTDYPFKTQCTKAQGNRKMQVAKNFIDKRQKPYTDIITIKGIHLRVNRSIQVEGAFGVLKSDYNFNRFLTRGKNSVKTEFILLCFGYNINKLHTKIQNERNLHPIKQTA